MLTITMHWQFYVSLLPKLLQKIALISLKNYNKINVWSLATLIRGWLTHSSQLQSGPVTGGHCRFPMVSLQFFTSTHFSHVTD